MKLLWQKKHSPGAFAPALKGENFVLVFFVFRIFFLPLALYSCSKLISEALEDTIAKTDRYISFPQFTSFRTEAINCGKSIAGLDQPSSRTSPDA